MISKSEKSLKKKINHICNFEITENIFFYHWKKNGYQMISFNLHILYKQNDNQKTNGKDFFKAHNFCDNS